jgi:hypothetical protein
VYAFCTETYVSQHSGAHHVVINVAGLDDKTYKWLSGRALTRTDNFKGFPRSGYSEPRELLIRNVLHVARFRDTTVQEVTFSPFGIHVNCSGSSVIFLRRLQRRNETMPGVLVSARANWAIA